MCKPGLKSIMLEHFFSAEDAMSPASRNDVDSGVYNAAQFIPKLGLIQA
jgi:hypothetical protein